MKDVLVKVKPSELSIHHTKEQIKRIETSFQSISNFRAIRVSYLID